LVVGERLDTGNRILSPYQLFNINGSYYFSDRAELFARIDNVADERYEEIFGFGTVGIAGYAGMNLLW
jgi:vitamin B12 transporter